MNRDFVRVGKYLDDEIEKYAKKFYSELHKKESDEEYDEEDLQRYRWTMVTLQKVNKDLHYPSDLDRFHVIQNMLSHNNHEGFETEFVFMDGSKIIVAPDMLVDFTDGFLMVFNREEYEKGPGIIPSIDSIHNIWNLKEVNTIRKPVK